MGYTIVGKIINTHGIRGEVKVYPLTNDVQRFEYLKEAFIGDTKVAVNVDGVKYHKGSIILKFKEYDDINQILKYKDSFIFVSDENRVILPENHYFIYDLIGCKVVDTNGNSIGNLKDVLQGHSNDVYVVEDGDNFKEYLIPAVKEFVKQVNINEKLITVDPIEGMIE
ncbi:ribosome maturation factor RimM [Tissierella sp. Yu-01]|uniref:ribosome maturation factor RimM n=1 Tax=Tissierella sp. Yu-01 TaxID=3035694 RepID=UPI00240D1E5F|nr:ribosome maturation factor RimM [Tissierella sp. Yu-01]WFA09782.1 ribosome maturation factor RimM [Tissierella sp. Yu-01]